ncbi:hypothetical protein [Marixanthomonas spongiae]|uniref:Uncharacterized protein n=1 Tax=Marixanthomonas spongiae TaxID=2174845 RepID=A0A2U0HU23_9FLAO|nr:hypothetical protein [Marixanthomonas spongiae]PVW12348.1 hypothetical protein DDV96_15180 [Marixanthomonas spongiae]
MVKLVAIDANGLNALFNGKGISFVKPFCEKENFQESTDKTADFSQIDFGSSQIVALTGVCTSQFQFELFSWESTILSPITVLNTNFSSNLSYPYLDNDSPPPRLA